MIYVTSYRFYFYYVIYMVYGNKGLFMSSSLGKIKLIRALVVVIIVEKTNDFYSITEFSSTLRYLPSSFVTSRGGFSIGIRCHRHGS